MSRIYALREALDAAEREVDSLSKALKKAKDTLKTRQTDLLQAIDDERDGVVRMPLLGEDDAKADEKRRRGAH